MRILIDGLVAKPGLGGIARVIQGVSTELAGRPGLEVALLISHPRVITSDDVQLILTPRSVQSYPRRVGWRERNLSRIVRDFRADVLLSSTIELPWRLDLGVPQVMTVHDLGPWDHPEWYGRPLWLRYQLGIPATVRRADGVVCVSDSTQAALRRRLPDITAPVITSGLAGRGLHSAAGSPTSAEPYVFSFGAMLHHKNVLTLMRAFDDADLVGQRLVLAGHLSPSEQRIFDTWRRNLRQPDRVRHLGFVDDITLASTIAEATVVALPSLHEGFGFPLLEALEAGKPVLASSIAAFREVGRDGAVYVATPDDPRAWARHLRELLDDPAERRELAERGRAVAATYSWTEVGDRILALLVELAGSP